MQKECSEGMKKVMEDAAGDTEKRMIGAMMNAMRQTDTAYGNRFDRIAKELGDMREKVAKLSEGATRSDHEVKA
eukprot:13589240-Heterocapsa_arctica.AAC.1